MRETGEEGKHIIQEILTIAGSADVLSGRRTIPASGKVGPTSFICPSEDPRRDVTASAAAPGVRDSTATLLKELCFERAVQYLFFFQFTGLNKTWKITIIQLKFM
jgi:hypothetical protein